jgi:HEAT repeat protein
MKWMLAVALGVAMTLASSAPVAARQGKGTKDVVVQGKTIGEWAKALQAKDVAARTAALNALMRAGPEARSAAPALVGLFADADTFLGLLAGVALRRIGADAVPALQKGLEDSRPVVRRMAARTLGLLGDAARPAVPALGKTLKDADPTVHAAAATALGRLGRGARAALPALTAALDDGDPAVQVEAASALWRVNGDARGAAVLAKAARGEDATLAEQAVAALAEMGPKAKESADAVRAALGSKDASLRIAAARALYCITKDAAAVLPLLESASRSSEAAERRAAVSALGALGAEEKAVVSLVRLLGDKDADLRREAASALSSREVKGEGASEALQAGLADADPGVRWWCALALAAGDGDVRRHEEEILRAFRLALFSRGDEEPAGKRAVEVADPSRAVPALVQVLRTRRSHLQLEAARTLGQGWLEIGDAREALVEALRSDDKLLRRAAAEALATLGAEALPELVKLAGNADARLREGAARALGQMGVQARSGVPALTRLLKDPEAAVRTQASLALWHVDQNAELALPTLTLVLKDVDNPDRWEAVEAVGVIAAEAQPRIKGLTEVMVVALKDRDARVRAQAARSLWRRTRDAKVIVPLLSDVVRDRDALARRIAVETLGEMGADDRAFTLLTQALEDRDVGLRLLAAEGLARGGAAAVPALLTSLEAKNPRVRQGAARSLGLIGAPAKKASEALGKLTKDPDAAVRAAAEEALRLLGKVSP